MISSRFSVITKPADLALIGDFRAVNDFVRGDIDFTTTVERFFKQADIDLMVGATVTALANYFTRGALGAYAIPETLAVAKASKFLRKDFPNICTNFFSKKAGKGTTGKLKSTGEAKPRLGTSGYKGGEYWNKLVDDAKGLKNLGVEAKKLDTLIGRFKRAKKIVRDGELKMDKAGNIYKFDRTHKNAKIHLEKIEETSKGFFNTAEVDPETGEIIKFLNNRPLGKQ